MLRSCAVIGVSLPTSDMSKQGKASLFTLASRGSNSAAGDKDSSHDNSLFSLLLNEKISSAVALITKWDSDSNYAKVTSLFSHGREDASRFRIAVTDLHHVMVLLSSPDCKVSPSSRTQFLLRAQTLMQSAMFRLESEFHQILSSSSSLLDPIESISSSLCSTCSDDETTISTISPYLYSDMTSDLRSIADTMISTGYSREVVRVYKLLRSPVIEESVFRLGFDLRLPISHLHKLDWPALNLRIRSWLSAARAIVSNLFTAEHLLCHRIFGGADNDSANLVESCFSDVTGDVALMFLSFPESVAKTKRSPEKLFRILDLYDTLSDLFPQIELTFSDPSMAKAISKAIDSLHALASAARDVISEFQLAVEKDSSKLVVPGAGVHPITRYTMNYLACLAEYVPTLADVYAGIPFQQLESIPEASSPCPATLAPMAVAERLAWLVFVLLCKLDHKAKFYKELSFSYLFLVNNLQYVVNKVRASELRLVLGERWAERHEETAWRYAESYIRIGWGKAAAALEEKELASFETAFEAAVKAEEGRVVENAGMREMVGKAIEGMILPAYRRLFESFMEVNNEAAAMCPPEKFMERLATLFAGSDVNRFPV